MRCLVLALAVVVAFTSVSCVKKEKMGQVPFSSLWLTDFETAKQVARKQNRPILMLLTGSDWCPACMALEAEALSKPEFLAYAKEHLVLLLVDFPAYKQVPADAAKINAALAERYDPTQLFPILLLLDAEGKELFRQEGYEPESGPKPLIGQLDAQLKKAAGKP